MLSVGIFSCGISSQAESWSNKYKYGINQPNVAIVINQAKQPLLISDASPIDILSLSHQLDKKVQIQLVKEHQKFKIPEYFQNIFLFQPSQQLRKSIEEKTDYQVVPVLKIKELWQLKK